MEFLKGLYKDTSRGKVPHGSWFDARNIVVSEKHRDASNEKGFTRFKQIDGVNIGYIVTNTKVVVFTDDSGVGDISIIDEQKNCTCILRSADLNFSIDNPIEGVFTYNNKQELIVAWWDGKADDANPPRVLNIDCLPFEVDSNCVPLDPDKIKLLQLFPDIGCAEFELNAVKDTGGNIVSGAYAFVYAYVLDDGTISNYTGISNWVPIVKDLSSSRFLDLDGDPANVFTSKAIELTLKDIDTNFDRIKIGVIKKIGGIISAVTLPTIEIPGTDYNFTYDGLSLEADIDIVSLLTPTSSFTRIKTGTVLENRLHVANAKQQGLLDYQPYANNIKVKWVRTDDINLAKVEDSYKDPIILFDKKGYAHDGVYAPVIVFKLKDGTFSRAFHIPNVEARDLTSFGYPGFNSNDLISDINTSFPETKFTEALAVDPNARYHEFFNDALSTGEMGYWENQDEVYPDEDCSDIKDNTGSVIGTLRGEKVRHHKFPALHQLENFGNSFYTPSTGSATTRVAYTEISGWAAGSPFNLDFNQNTVVNGAYFVVDYSVDGFKITAQQDFEGYVNYKLDLENLNINTSFILKHQTATGTVEIGREDNENNIFDVDLGGFRFQSFISMQTGDSLIFEGKITGSPIITFPTISFSEIFFDLENTSESDGTTKVMGFTLEDVHVPNEIKEKVDCYYIGYLKRTINNTTKFAQTRFKAGVVTVHGVYNFDTKFLEPPVTPSYIKPEYTYTVAEGNLLFNTPTTVISNEIRAVTNSSYIPAGIITTFESQKIDTREDKSSTLFIKLQNALASGDFTTGSVYQYKKNLYNIFANQKVVLIPKKQDINSATTGSIYGGDVSINIVGYYGNGTFEDYPKLGAFFRIDIQETASTVGYRYADLETNELYPPNYVTSEFNFLIAETKPINEAYLYNLDYNSLNDLLPIIPAKCYGDCDPLEPINDFPFRIARSPKQLNESNIINWRKFFVNDYYEMRDRDKGEIWKLQAFNRTLIIYQKYAMFVARPKDILKADNIAAALGEGDIFDRKPDEIAPDGKGYAGNQSQWAVFVCKHGVIHIDAQQGKVFVFNGQITEISNKGMYHFFEDLRDVQEQTDNPFNSSGWIASFDERNNRLIITKHAGADTLTISYSFNHNAWVCLHDYFPNAIFYTRDYLFSIVNNTANGTADIYEHNIEYKFGIYYEDAGEFPVFESYIEAIFNTPTEITKIWKAITWQTVIEDEEFSEYFYDETFTHILIYNNNQCTGIVTLDKEKNLNLLTENIRNAEYTWKFNKFRDIVIDRNKRIIDKKGVINTANLNNSLPWWKKSKFISKFIAIRLIYNNVEQKAIHIQHINVLATKSAR